MDFLDKVMKCPLYMFVSKLILLQCDSHKSRFLVDNCIYTDQLKHYFYIFYILIMYSIPNDMKIVKIYFALLR